MKSCSSISRPGFLSFLKHSESSSCFQWLFFLCQSCSCRCVLFSQWCLDEFKRIYRWLNARFDHDFFESEVAAESKQTVAEYQAKGVFVMNDGAVGADLSQVGLGFQILLKRDGTGLYATKDLALARRKFEQFHIDKSIYVVDSAQSFHFQQVFATLKMMGYPQAERCYHLPYGLVILPDGKMSSRKGNFPH